MHRTFITRIMQAPRLLAFLIMSSGVMIFACGCIQMEHELQIGSDGSAVYRLDYAISEQAISQIAAMNKLRNELTVAAGESVPPDMPIFLQTFLNPSLSEIREYVDSLSEYGITIRSLRENTRALWRHYAITLDIESLSTFEKSPIFSAYGFHLEKDGEGHYVLNRPPLTEPDPENPQRFSQQELKQIRPFLAGFSTEIRIRVPGRIISTTAHRTAQQTATWQFRFDQQPDAVQRLMEQRLHLVFMSPASELPNMRTDAQTEP